MRMLMDCGPGSRPPPTLVVPRPLMCVGNGQQHRDRPVVPSSSHTYKGGQVSSGDTGPSGAGGLQEGSCSL